MIICPECRFAFRSNEYACHRCGYAPVLINGFPAFAPEKANINDGFKPEYFDLLYNIETHSFWFNYRNDLFQYFFKHYFPKAKNFCEIGCGTGNVLSSFADEYPNIQITGSEIYSAALQFVASRTSRAQLIQADACCFPFENEFDVIGAFDVLEHINHDDIVLKNLHRATKPNGGIILSVPQHNWLWSYEDEAAYHKRRYSRRDLKQKIEKAGFHIERITSFISLLLPLMMASRLKIQLFKKHYDPVGEIKMPLSVNLFLYKICMLEKKIILHGTNLPFGGSLICIAKKV